MQNRKIVFFDLDGPLRNASLIGWSEFLFEKGLFNEDCLNKQTKLKEQLVAGKIEYSEMAKKTVELYGKGINGKKVKDLEKASKEFALTDKLMGLEKYALDLLKLFENDTTVLVTGQPHVLAESIRAHLGINYVSATLAESKDGVFTGKIIRDNTLYENKLGTVKKYLQIFPINNSFAFADRLEDRGMFEEVKYPICINGDKQTIDYCKKQNWFIVNGKNILETVKELILIEED